MTFKQLWRKIFGDPYAFRRVDNPGVPEHKLPKCLQDVDVRRRKYKR